jgi:hypothetical protein
MHVGQSGPNAIVLTGGNGDLIATAAGADTSQTVQRPAVTDNSCDGDLTGSPSACFRPNSFIFDQLELFGLRRRPIGTNGPRPSR